MKSLQSPRSLEPVTQSSKCRSLAEGLNTLDRIQIVSSELSSHTLYGGLIVLVVLGVRNALLRSLRLQHPNNTFSSEATYSTSVKGAGLVIGGGATTRSSAHALTLLGLSPIYLINRDPAEVQVILDSMPHLASKGGLIHLKNPEDVEAHLVGPDAPKLLMAVGCIRQFIYIVSRNLFTYTMIKAAIQPSTFAERMVYSTAVSVFNLPYSKPTLSAGGDLPYPTSRLFLEMPVCTYYLMLSFTHAHSVFIVQASTHSNAEDCRGIGLGCYYRHRSEYYIYLHTFRV